MGEVNRNQDIPSVEQVSPENNEVKEIKPEGEMTFQDAQEFWNNYFASEIKECSFYSTYDEPVSMKEPAETDEPIAMELSKPNEERIDCDEILDPDNLSDIFEEDRTEKKYAEGDDALDTSSVNAKDKTDSKEGSSSDAREFDEKDNAEKKQMQPPVGIQFTCKEKYDRAEYERQVKNQEEGLNNISLYDYIKNRERYKENGRDVDVGGQAQEKARQEARADRIAENRRNGMNREDAEKEADDWLNTQAALHDPDQIAGGDAANVTGMGDKEINSSIGSQWQYRIEAVDSAVQKYVEENGLTEEELKNVYMNVKLEVVQDE